MQHVAPETVQSLSEAEAERIQHDKGHIQSVIEAVCERLMSLTKRTIARSRYVDSESLDELGALHDLMFELAHATDPLFSVIASCAAVGGKDDDGSETVVTDAVNCGRFELDYELRHKMEEIASERPYSNPNAEHRLSARQLGVGRAA